MTVADILEQIQQLTPDEQDELIQHILELRIHTRIQDPYYDLDTLLGGITPDNLHGEIGTGNPVGKEVW